MQVPLQPLTHSPLQVPWQLPVHDLPQSCEHPPEQPLEQVPLQVPPQLLLQADEQAPQLVAVEYDELVVYVFVGWLFWRCVDASAIAPNATSIASHDCNMGAMTNMGSVFFAACLKNLRRFCRLSYSSVSIDI